VIEVGGGVAVIHPLPAEGIDLRAELAGHIRSRIEQALERAQGNHARAAKLLQLTQLDFLRMLNSATPPLVGSRPEPRESPVAPAEFSRIERGREVISRAAIRRLDAAGFTARQIAGRFAVNELFVEEVLRAEAELAKCGPGDAVHPEERKA
jgi:hypothetical protein